MDNVKKSENFDSGCFTKTKFACEWFRRLSNCTHKNETEQYSKLKIKRNKL